MVDASISYQISTIRYDTDFEEIEQAVCHTASTDNVVKDVFENHVKSSAQYTPREKSQCKSHARHCSKEQ